MSLCGIISAFYMRPGLSISTAGAVTVPSSGGWHACGWRICRSSIAERKPVDRHRASQPVCDLFDAAVVFLHECLIGRAQENDEVDESDKRGDVCPTEYQHENALCGFAKIEFMGTKAPRKKASAAAAYLLRTGR